MYKYMPRYVTNFMVLKSDLKFFVVILKKKVIIEWRVANYKIH